MRRLKNFLLRNSDYTITNKYECVQDTKSRALKRDPRTDNTSISWGPTQQPTKVGCPSSRRQPTSLYHQPITYRVSTDITKRLYYHNQPTCRVSTTDIPVPVPPSPTGNMSGLRQQARNILPYVSTHLLEIPPQPKLSIVHDNIISMNYSNNGLT